MRIFNAPLLDANYPDNSMLPLFAQKTRPESPLLNPWVQLGSLPKSPGSGTAKPGGAGAVDLTVYRRRGGHPFGTRLLASADRADTNSSAGRRRPPGEPVASASSAPTPAPGCSFTWSPALTTKAGLPPTAVLQPRVRRPASATRGTFPTRRCRH
jgi:hypothetical protein